MFSKTFLIFLGVYFLSGSSHGQRDQKFFRRDYSYIETEESFYKIHTIPHTWSDAKRVCALEGATFWHPDNDDEARAVVSFWKKTQPNMAWVFTGMSRITGVFETVEGKTQVYNNWSPGQPDNNQERENCTCLNFGAMHDCWCESVEHFICKKSLQSLQWNYCCNTYDLDYIHNKDNGKCYKLYTTPLNWMEAHAVCRAEQSYLAVVNNKKEADYLASLTESTPKQRVEGNYFRGIYHLGFHSKLLDGWRTIKGTTMHVDADIWWDNYQPEVPGQCGSMFFNGRLNNVNCATKSFFICEHDVDSWKNSLP